MVATMVLTAQTVSNSDSSEIRLRKNSLYVELGGNGLLWSINYERIIPIKKQTAVFVRVGGSIFGSQVEEKTYFNPLFESGVLLGGPRFYFDPGIGYTWFPSEGLEGFVIRTGGRFQGKKGLMIRLGLLLVVMDSYGPISAGAAVGYSF